MPGTFGDNFFCERITCLCVGLKQLEPSSHTPSLSPVRPTRPAQPHQAQARRITSSKRGSDLSCRHEREARAARPAVRNRHHLPSSEIGNPYPPIRSSRPFTRAKPMLAGAQNDNASIAATMRSPGKQCSRHSRRRRLRNGCGEAQKRFTGPLTINSGQSHAGARVVARAAGGRPGVDCCRHARRAHRLHRSIRRRCAL